MKPYKGMQLFATNLKKAWDARQPSGILCHRFKFIYFPIAKVAGSSMRAMIAEAEGIPINGKPHLIPFDWAQGKELERYSGYRRIAVVRNPWARILACYKNKIVWQHNASGEIARRSDLTPGFARYNRLLGRTLFHPEMAFEDFVKVVARIPDALSDRHFRSQHKSFCHTNGKPIVDSIVRLERFREDMNEFLSSIGADEIEIKHLNSSRRSKHADQFDSDLAKLVARRYRRDVKLLDYRGPE